MSEVIAFTIDGKATAWARAGGRGHVRFTPAHVRSYQTLVRMMAQQAMGDRLPFDGPCALGVRVTIGIPTSWSQKRQRAAVNAPCTTRPDLSNYVKLVEDACNTVIYRDDSQVTDYLETWKRYGDKPRVEIEVREVE